MATILDGKALAQSVKEKVKENIANFELKYGKKVKLAVVLVGENPASQVYVRNKIKACEYVGIESLSFVLPQDSTQAQVEQLINELATNDEVDGILVQLPLPKQIDEEYILSKIPASKDVDGFLAENIGNLAMNKPSIVACTPMGIMTMLKSSGVQLSGKNAVVVGRSNIVGKPISMLLLNENCTVTICHSKTENLKEICLTADILVAAIGKTEFITGDMVKEGAIVIDVGINRTENGLKGDVHFESASQRASFITPVPGGVGPMTIATLMENTYKCALKKYE